MLKAVECFLMCLYCHCKIKPDSDLHVIREVKLPHNVLHLIIILLIGHSKRGINTLTECIFVPEQCLLCYMLNKHFH